VYCLAGTSNYYQDKRVYSNPWLIAGLLGTVIILLISSFDVMWIGARDSFLNDISFNSPLTYITLLLLLLSLFIIMKRYRTQGWDVLSPLEFSPFVFLVYQFIAPDANKLALLLINAWILAIGLYYIRKGSVQHHLGILNLGLLIIASLAVFRFFDESIPFVWRGIFFLAAGIGFFAANYLVIKRKRSLPAKQTA
ncbi:MAG: hypothetical protein WCF67_20925, partial [Chitinophagaceae bacterium]